MRTFVSLLVVLAFLIPVGGFAAEPPEWDEFRSGLLRKLNKKGPKAAKSMIVERLGDNWCRDPAPVRLRADMVSIMRRAGFSRDAFMCAEETLDRLPRDIPTDERVKSALWFEASMAARKLTADDLAWIAERINLGGGESVFDRFEQGCASAKLIINFMPFAAVFIDELQKLVAGTIEREQLQALKSRFVAMKKGEPAAARELAALQRNLSREFRRRAFETAPSATLRDRMARDGEELTLPSDLLLERQSWKPVPAKTLEEIRGRKQGDRYTSVVWEEAHEGTFAWAQMTDQEKCSVYNFVFVTAGGSTFWPVERYSGSYNGPGLCGGYGSEYDFHANFDEAGRTFQMSFGSSSYINGRCGPLGRSYSGGSTCERLDDGVVCINESRFVEFNQGEGGVYRVSLRSIPPDLREVFAPLEGQTPAQVFDEIPRIHAQLSAFLALARVAE